MTLAVLSSPSASSNPSSMQLNRIYHEDCLVGLKQITTESIDLVVTDMPYKICAGGCSPHGGNPKGILKREREYVADDSADVVRAGKLFKHNDIYPSEWLPDVYRVLKQSTHCYIMVNARNLKDLQVEAEKVGFIFQQLLVWKKDNCVMNKYYMNQLEFILMLRKGAAKNVNDMGISNCLSCPNIIGKGEQHYPTQKPVALMEVLIRQSSNEGDIVLDPFAGSGSTLIAAKRLNRRYIGFEIDKQYYDMAVKRLETEPQQMSMF